MVRISDALRVVLLDQPCIYMRGALRCLCCPPAPPTLNYKPTLQEPETQCAHFQ